MDPSTTDRRPLPASIGTGADVSEAERGQLAHHATIDHTNRLERKLYEVRPGVWSLVGNGLSNQNFVEGPGGLIVIDTGESTEEMAWALNAVREQTQAPVVAVIYTHFHYVSGTAALWNNGDTPPAIWGHEGIVENRRRVGVDLSAAAGRGLVHQFGMLLPHDGEDGLVNSGLGIHFRNPEHAPFTEGFLAPTHTFAEATSANIAGLQVEFTPAPSDADDSVTIWFPELGVAVNNILWPLLFNVFAIRGEQYRDPRILLSGLDHLASLGAQHLVCAHGPPLSGKDEIAADAERYRDSIQFMWDQTVRGINRGMNLSQLTEFVQLPAM
ncbi:MAG: alkyl sulfatase BDS1-like metallo-beta-lactamase superfamily hydrolase [Candidatus Poriferisodalaceae bacterium]|jgi:alkyl sulfatase BDS1-like metallo-beta-lactamase superfamily hydrolase